MKKVILFLAVSNEIDFVVDKILIFNALRDDDSG
jgi:hypothetical protein